MPSWTSASTPVFGGSSPLAFTTVNVGDIVWVASLVSSGTATITYTCPNVSGGFNYFAATKALVASGGYGVRLGWGIVTATGSTSITVSTTAGSLAVVFAGEVTPPSGLTTVAQDGAQTFTDNTSSTTITYPSITPTGASDFYLGWGVPINNSAAGSTSGFVYVVDAGSGCQVCYSLTAPNPSAPTAPTALGGGWDATSDLLIPSSSGGGSASASGAVAAVAVSAGAGSVTTSGPQSATVTGQTGLAWLTIPVGTSEQIWYQAVSTGITPVIGVTASTVVTAVARPANVSAQAQSPSVNIISGTIANAAVAAVTATAAAPSVTTSSPTATAVAGVAIVAAQAQVPIITTAGGTVVAVAGLATVSAVAPNAVADTRSPFTVFTFTPPTLTDTPAIAYYDRAMRQDGTVTSEWRVDRANPLGFRLFQWFKQRPQGVAIYKMSDGTWRSDRAVPGITTQTAWPPVPIDQQVNGAINQSWYAGRMVNDYVQDPAIVTVYYGGMSYRVDETEADALIAGGFGAYVTSEVELH